MIKNSKNDFSVVKLGNWIGDSRRTNMFLNELSGRQKRILHVPALSSNIAHSISDSKKVVFLAETFNTFFVNIGKSIQDDLQGPSRESKIEDVDFIFFLTPVGYSEVKKILISFENKTRSGCNNCTNTLVKTLAPATIELLADFFNLSFKNSVFPNNWNSAKVIPLHKIGFKDCVNNYRPISLLPVWSKVFERAMHTRFYGFFSNV